MTAPDLFGKEGRLPQAALRPVDPPARLSLFDHAAERAALETGRPASQERLTVGARDAEDATAWRKRMGYACPACHAAPDIRCRKTCALRRADPPAVAAALGIDYATTTILDALPNARIEDDFDEDERDFIDEGADVDACWITDELAAEAAGDPSATPEAAPVCDECHVAATIHEWASPRGREGFPCPPGSFERDRAAYEASLHVGQRAEQGSATWEVTQHAYTRTSEGRPAWFTGDVLRADLARYRSANCYGAHWVERRVVRDPNTPPTPRTRHRARNAPESPF